MLNIFIVQIFLKYFYILKFNLIFNILIFYLSALFILKIKNLLVKLHSLALYTLEPARFKCLLFVIICYFCYNLLFLLFLLLFYQCHKVWQGAHRWRKESLECALAPALRNHAPGTFAWKCSIWFRYFYTRYFCLKMFDLIQVLLPENGHDGHGGGGGWGKPLQAGLDRKSAELFISLIWGFCAVHDALKMNILGEIVWLQTGKNLIGKDFTCGRK